MSMIHVLDDSTINKIAAGEVVERPASVIKELVENAMDAGATRIEVEIMAGGTSFMRVTDNGRGMSAEDARLAILRHATSKICEVGDLNTIGTLGFRGEALPTIASVSRFTLLTRRAGDDLGTRVSITGGKEPDFIEAGCSIGTTVKVEDLFFNTPARKKFLKTNHTEGSKINDFIVKLALSRPDIEFHFINNNKMSVVTPGNGNLYDTIQAIYGGKTADSLLGLSLDDEDVKISGYITKPSMLKSSRAWQTYIVNSRIIQNRAIAKAIDNAYKSLIPKSGFPLTVINIEVPQRSIDVNVHPQKSELKFEDESRIFKAVYKAVLDAIRPAGRGLGEVAAVVEKPEHHVEAVSMEPMRFVPATEPLDTPVIPAWPRDSKRNGRSRRPSMKPCIRARRHRWLTSLRHRQSCAPSGRLKSQPARPWQKRHRAFSLRWQRQDPQKKQNQVKTRAQRMRPSLMKGMLCRLVRSTSRTSSRRMPRDFTSSTSMPPMNAFCLTNSRPWPAISRRSSFWCIRF